jgi:opacity protein-like surface antigen
MEDSLSMPELTSLLVAKREKDYEEKKFLAAVQGIDLDKENGNNRGQKEWEDIKARVFSRGQSTDSNDIVSLQGANTAKSGFGIGAGLDYAIVKDSKNPKNPMKP